MTKKIIISIFLITVLYLPVYSQNYSALEKMENSMFGMTYNSENEKTRIERLEKNIYGSIQKGNTQARLERLSKDMSAELLGQEIPPTKYTEFEEKEDNTVDYPIINKLEKQIFNSEHKNQNIKIRLSNLEKKVFNKTFENDDLSTRTERLKASIHIPTQIPKETEYFENFDQLAYTPEEVVQKPFKNKKYDANVGKILTALEKKVFKKTYQNEPEEERIERLEENMFNTSFPQDNMESRLERLALAYQATKTSKKYDTNKLSQHMATAMQVGMFLLMILAMVL